MKYPLLSSKNDFNMLEDNPALNKMLQLIVTKLFKAIDPNDSKSLRTMAETPIPFNDTSWFWVDDAAKMLELFSIPEIKNKYPNVTEDILNYILRLSEDDILHRRMAQPDLQIKQYELNDFYAYNSFYTLRGDLNIGKVSPAIRYNDDRTRSKAEYSGNYIRFEYMNKLYTVDIEDNIIESDIKVQSDLIEFWHNSLITITDSKGNRQNICNVGYSYTLRKFKSTVGVKIQIELVDNITVSKINITSAIDQIDKEQGFSKAEFAYLSNNRKYADMDLRDIIYPDKDENEHQLVIGEKLAEEVNESKIVDGHVKFLCLHESNTAPGFSNALNVLYKQPEMVKSIIAESITCGKFHLVYALYEINDSPLDNKITLLEERLLIGGGYYHNINTYYKLMLQSDEKKYMIDPSSSYDIGAELTAIATYIYFGLQDGTIGSKNSLDLKAWFDKHVKAYMLNYLPTNQHPKIFYRGLAFVTISLEIMQRIFPCELYYDFLDRCVEVLLNSQQDIEDINNISILGTSSELDSHSSIMLALARVYKRKGCDPRISKALINSLRAISIKTVKKDAFNKPYLYNTLLLDDGEKSDNSLWNYKNGLVLRSACAIQELYMQNLLDLDKQTLDHLEVIILVARKAIQSSSLVQPETIEILTSERSGETNSETQPWAILGLFPFIEKFMLSN